MMHAVILCTLLVLTIGAPYPPKRLAGPVEEFAFHRIADPSTVLTSDRSSSQYIWFDTTLPGSVYTTTIPVDGPNEFIFTFASPQASKLALKLVDPNGKEVDLSAIKQDDTFPIGDTIKVPISTYIVANSIQGFYTLSITLNGLTVEEADVLAANPYPNAILTVINNDDLEIQSHLSSYLIDVGDTIGIVSTLVNLQAGAAPETVHVTHAEMDVITPDGRDLEVQMHNDAAIIGNSAPANSFGAIITANVPGNYLVQARLEGWIDGGVATAAVPFTRTTEHVIGVSAAALGIAGSAQLRPDDATHVWIDVNVKQLAQTGKTLDEINFRAYGEIWGIEASSGKPKAACWIGGVSGISTQTSGTVLSLQLDTAWLQRAGVQVPLTLKNFYVTDMSTSFPVAKFDGDIPVQSPTEFHVKLLPELLNMEITPEMRVGISPLPTKTNGTAGSRAAVSNLVLLPGYCASVNPWSKEFSQAEYFVEQGNFGHDEYAQKVMNFISSKGPDSFSLIGHSQGGFVALHINNYYFTPLENAQGGRLIQTVGTPWGGCTAAGDAASLGSVFGVGCGKNSDLTLDGAANWLAGISLQARAKVHSYTTTYKQGNLIGDYCSLPLNLILQWPNDGTTELKYGKLSGGVYEGNTEKQCHTSGMKYMAQTEDKARNTLMNKAAAR